MAPNGSRSAARRIVASTSQSRLRRVFPDAAGSLRHNVRTAVTRSSESPFPMRERKSPVAPPCGPARGHSTCRGTKGRGPTMELAVGLVVHRHPEGDHRGRARGERRHASRSPCSRLRALRRTSRRVRLRHAIEVDALARRRTCPASNVTSAGSTSLMVSVVAGNAEVASLRDRHHVLDDRTRDVARVRRGTVDRVADQRLGLGDRDVRGLHQVRAAVREGRILTRHRCHRCRRRTRSPWPAGPPGSPPR